MIPEPSLSSSKKSYFFEEWLLKVTKSQKQFFLELHAQKTNEIFDKILPYEARAFDIYWPLIKHYGLKAGAVKILKHHSHSAGLVDFFLSFYLIVKGYVKVIKKVNQTSSKTMTKNIAD